MARAKTAAGPSEAPAPRQPKAPVAYKFPKTFGACADLLYDIREERLAAQRVVDAIQARENALKDHVIANLPKSEGGAIGKHHKVQVVTKEVPQVKDWDAFYRYVARTKGFDLLQRRLSPEAVAVRREAGKEVPGVEDFKVVTLSLTKV